MKDMTQSTLLFVPGGDDSDALLEGFFAEIENLCIEDDESHHDVEGSNAETATTTTNTAETSRHREGDHCSYFNTVASQRDEKRASCQQRKVKQDQVRRAEQNRVKWTTFQIEKGSSRDGSDGIAAAARTPISFSIASKKSKKKTKTKKVAPKFIESEDDDNRELDSNKSRRNPSFEFFPPQWIAVLDTNAILESFDSVRRLIVLAKQAKSKSNRQVNIHAGVQRRDEIYEEITIVVPYTVWEELDFRSKDPNNKDLNYRARRGTRLLNEELRRNHSHGTWKKNDSVENHCIVRNQSRFESLRATSEFVESPFSSQQITSTILNDDRILACALDEKQRHTDQFVVLITSDKVLTGKACAEKVSAYTPSGFLQYYQKRMNSLRARS